MCVCVYVCICVYMCVCFWDPRSFCRDVCSTRCARVTRKYLWGYPSTYSDNWLRQTYPSRSGGVVIMRQRRVLPTFCRSSQGGMQLPNNSAGGLL